MRYATAVQPTASKPPAPSSPGGFRLLSLLLIITALFNVTPTFCELPQTNKVHYFQEVSRWPGYKVGPAVGVAGTNNLAFVASSEGGLIILDIANPLDPKILSRFHTSGSVTSVAVTDRSAYITDSQQGLLAIDVSAPGRPSIVATHALPGPGYDLARNGDTLFLISANTLLGFDISNPGALFLQFSVPIAQATFPLARLTLSGGLALIRMHGGVENYIYSLGGRSGPTKLAQYNNQDPERGIMAGVQQYALVPLWRAFHVLDITIPRTPALVGGGFYLGIPEAAISRSHLLYAAVYSDWGTVPSPGLRIIDFADPTAPKTLPNVPTPSVPKAVALHDHFALVPDTEGHLNFVDVTDPAAPKLSTSMPLGGPATGLAVRGQHTYLLDGGMQILNVADPERPAKIGYVPQVHSVDFYNNIAAVSHRHTFRLIDLSNPASPVELGRNTLRDYAGFGYRKVTMVDKFAFVSGYSVDEGSPNEFGEVYDLNNTTEVKPFRSVYSGRPMAVNSNLVYEFGNGLRVAEIAGPPPWEWRSLSVSHSMDFGIIRNQILYAIRNNFQTPSQLILYKLNNPLNPIFLGVCNLPFRSRDISVHNNIVYLPSDTGLYQIDVSDPAEPVLLGQFNDSTLVAAVDFTAGGLLALAAGSDGLRLVSPQSKYSQTIQFSPPANLPVPTASYQLTATITSGLPVTFTVLSGPARVDGDNLTITNKGAVRLRAHQTGSADYLPATVEITINQPAPIRLSARRTAGSLELFWPADGEPWILEERTHLDGRDQWRPSDATVTTTATENSVRLVATGAPKYFRLRSAR